MLLRVATCADIPQLHALRMAVLENVLSDPNLICESDYRQALETLGRGWLVEDSGELLGFALAYRDGRIWALFVHPQHEGKGVGGRLHSEMLAWLWHLGLERLRLDTEPGTRAEGFYRRRGWLSCGLDRRGELQLELPRPKP